MKDGEDGVGTRPPGCQHQSPSRSAPLGTSSGAWARRTLTAPRTAGWEPTRVIPFILELQETRVTHLYIEKIKLVLFVRHVRQEKANNNPPWEASTMT